MVDPSMKRDQVQSTSAKHDVGPPPISEVEVEEPRPREKGIEQTFVYQRKRQKLLTNRGKRPAQSSSSDDAPVEVGNEVEGQPEEEQKTKRRKVAENEGPRNRSLPARLFKLNKGLIEDQQNVIRDIEFGGLLQIKATSMPGELSQWIMKHYDPEMSQIVIPDRGKIPVDAESVRRIWGLPNRRRKVSFEMNPDVIREFNSIYKIEGKNAPTLTLWCKMIEKMNGAADNNFLRAWLAVAFSCFLAPTTSLSISPRCYTAIMDTDAIKESKICDFVVDQLRLAFMGFGEKKKAVCCCVFHLVILYLDSLEVDETIPCTLPRAPLWNDELIAKVMKKDKKGPGVYGKLRLKTEFSRCAKDSLFGSMDHITKFVAARLPESYDKNKQKMLAGMVHEMCTEMSHAVGKLVFGIGKLDDRGDGTSANAHCTMGTSYQQTGKKQKAKRRVVEQDSTEDEESFNSDGESYEEEESEDNETDSEKDEDKDSDEDDLDDDDDNPQPGNTVGVEEEVQVDDVHDNPEEGNTAVDTVGVEEEDQRVSQAKPVDKYQGKWGDVSITHETDASKRTKEVQGVEDPEIGETEEEDEDEEDDDEQASERKKDDFNGNDEDDQGGGGGDNTAAGTCGGNSDGDQPGTSSGSTNGGDVSKEFYIKKNDGKAKGANEPESVSLVDIVMMEFKKQWKPMEGEKLELPELYDGRSAASYADMLMQRVMEGEDMQMACNFILEEFCPQLTEEELMRQICGFKDSVPKKKGETNPQLPPLPPRKQKRVSFKLEPNQAKTLDPRHASRPLVSALKHKGQVQLKSEASQVKTAATYMGVQAVQRKAEEASQFKMEGNCMGIRAVQTTTEAHIAGAPGNKQVAREIGQPQQDLNATSASCKQGSPDQADTKKLDVKTKEICTREQADITPLDENTSIASSNPKLPTVDLRLPATSPQSTHTSLVKNNPKLPLNPSKMMQNNIKLLQTDAKLPTSIQKFSRRAFVEVSQATSPVMALNSDAKNPQLATQPTTHVKPANSVAQLLKTNLKLPTVNQKTAGKRITELKEGMSVSELPKIDPKFSRPSSKNANKENCPPGSHKEKCPGVLNIDEIFAKCVIPSSNQTKHPPAYIVEEPSEELQDVPKLQGMWDEYCPAPNFGLILEDLDTICEETTKVSNKCGGTTIGNEPSGPEVDVTEVINVEDDEWEAIEEACAAAERRSNEPVGGQEAGTLSPNIYNTPIKVTSETALGSDGNYYSSSSSGEAVTNKFERRLIKTPACLRSPFMDPDNKKEFYCKPEANRLYASMILHARLSAQESQDEDRSPKIIDFNGYYVSLRELADSMKVEGVVLSHVFEVGISSIMMNLPADSRKVVMPLRFSIRLQQMTWDTQEINNRFNRSNHLDRKDMIMFPILENMDPAKVKTGNHYWVFNLNIRDRRFEVLDSLRSLDDVYLNENARRIAATIRCMWDHHYGKSRVVLDDFQLVNIDVPRQNNDVDCGIYGLTNASKWDARAVPKYGPDDIPSIRKHLTNTWVSSVHNK